MYLISSYFNNFFYPLKHYLKKFKFKFCGMKYPPKSEKIFLASKTVLIFTENSSGVISKFSIFFSLFLIKKINILLNFLINL